MNVDMNKVCENVGAVVIGAAAGLIIGVAVDKGVELIRKGVDKAKEEAYNWKVKKAIKKAIELEG